MTTADPILRIANRIVRAMAYRRVEFKNKVEEHVGGAILEHYKARLARKNGQTKWVQHWETEVRTLIDRNLVVVLAHEIKGFTDRRKAAQEVFVAIQAKDTSYRAIAERIILRDYGLKKVRIHLDDEDTEAFWERVNFAVEAAL